MNEQDRAIDRVLGALESHGCVVKPLSGYYWMAQCPGHDDVDPSLSIRATDDRVLLCCHAGCHTSAVLGALGLAYRDLFDGAAPSVLKAGELVCEYLYRDADGIEIGAVQRYDNPKSFRPLRPVGDHGWAVGASPALKVTPYRADEVRAAIRAGRPILVVEGERDVDTAWSLGLAATCNQAGAGKWKPSHAAHLRGADVTVVRDQDPPGRKHAAKVHTSLQGVARSVRVVDPAPGCNDFTEHVEAVHGVEQLIDVTSSEAHEIGRRARVTWASEIEPEPVVWAWEDDGEGRIAAASLCLAAGREGTGKSSFGAYATARITRGTLPGSLYGRPRRVLYVAVEDSWKHTLVPRLMAAGADLSKVGRFDVITDEDSEGTLSLPHDNAMLEAEIIRNDVALVVIDPLMSAIGATIDTHRERDVRTALDPLSRLADRTGAVVLGIAHFNKSSGTDAANLITGSGAFKNVARAVLGFARDDDGRVMTQVKNSLGRDDLTSLGYSITEAEVPTRLGVARTAKFDFTGPSSRSVADVLRDANGSDDPDEQDDRSYTVTWLKNYLIHQGGSAPFADVLKAATEVDIKERTLKRARRGAGVASERKGFQKGATWSIETPHSGHVVGESPGNGPNGPNGPAEGDTPPGQPQSGHPGHSSTSSRASGPDGGPDGEDVCARCRRASDDPLIAGKCRSCAYPPGTDSPHPTDQEDP